MRGRELKLNQRGETRGKRENYWGREGSKRSGNKEDEEDGAEMGEKGERKLKRGEGR